VHTFLTLPREIRNQIYHYLFRPSQSIIATHNRNKPLGEYLEFEDSYNNFDWDGDCAEHADRTSKSKSKSKSMSKNKSTPSYKLREPLPLQLLRVNNHVHAEAMEALLEMCTKTPFILELGSDSIVEFLCAVPKSVRNAISMIFITSMALYADDRGNQMAWSKDSSEVTYTPMYRFLIRNLHLKDLAIFVPASSGEMDFYCSYARSDACKMLHARHLDVVRFVYRAALPGDKHIQELPYVENRGGLVVSREDDPVHEGYHWGFESAKTIITLRRRGFTPKRSAASMSEGDDGIDGPPAKRIEQRQSS